MKKFIVFFTALLILSGCFENKKKDEVNKRDDYYFIFATPLVDHPIWQHSYDGFKDACDELDVKCDWIGPKVIDTEQMEKTINVGIMQKADGIITQGVISPAILDNAYQNKIPIILVDANIESNNKFAYYGKNFKEQAQLFLLEIEKDLGEYAYLNISIQVAEAEFDIAKEQIKEIENVFETHLGGYQIIEISESKSDRVRAQSEWNRVLEKNPNINVSLNFAAESANACAEAVAKMNRKEEIKIYAVDDIDTTIKYIKAGKIDASVVTSFYQYGYDALKLLYDYAEHKTYPQNTENYVSLLTVNKENVDKYKELLRNEK